MIVMCTYLSKYESSLGSIILKINVLGSTLPHNQVPFIGRQPTISSLSRLSTISILDLKGSLDRHNLLYPQSISIVCHLCVKSKLKVVQSEAVHRCCRRSFTTVQRGADRIITYHRDYTDNYSMPQNTLDPDIQTEPLHLWTCSESYY